MSDIEITAVWEVFGERVRVLSIWEHLEDNMSYFTVDRVGSFVTFVCNHHFVPQEEGFHVQFQSLANVKCLGTNYIEDLRTGEG